jgi:hypothetical protein
MMRFFIKLFLVIAIIIWIGDLLGPNASPYSWLVLGCIALSLIAGATLGIVYRNKQ